MRLERLCGAAATAALIGLAGLSARADDKWEQFGRNLGNAIVQDLQRQQSQRPQSHVVPRQYAPDQSGTFNRHGGLEAARGRSPDASGSVNSIGGGWNSRPSYRSPDMTGNFNTGGSWHDPSWNDNQVWNRPQQPARPQYQPQVRPQYVEPQVSQPIPHTTWRQPTPVWQPSGVVQSGHAVSGGAVRPNVIPAVPRAAAPAAKIKIVLPKDAGGRVGYALNGHTYEIAPGESQTLDDHGRWTVRFDRGGDYGVAEYRLIPGTYTFAVTERGWELFSPKPSSDEGLAAVRLDEVPSP